MRAYYLEKFPNQDYQIDTYMLFMEQGLYLTKEQGFWGMIIPNPWLSNIFTKKLRRFMFSQTSIHNLVHYTQKVFKRVTVDTETVIAQKGFMQDHIVTIDRIDTKKGSKTYKTFQEGWRALDGEIVNVFMDDLTQNLIQKIDDVSEPLSTFCRVTVGIKPYQVGKGSPKQTQEIVEKRIYDATHKVDGTYRSYLRGRDINRYALQPIEERWISYGKWLAEPRLTANFNAPEKLLMRQTGDRPIAMLDTEQYLCLNNLHVIELKGEIYDIRYILGLVNSRLSDKYYETLNPEKGEALAEVKKTFVEQLPIRHLDLTNPTEKAQHDQLVNMVEKMLTLKKQQAAANDALNERRHELQEQIEYLDKRIDALVYEIYSLTKDEIRLLEGN